ncbi:MAG: hypothetical protein ACI3YA_02495, partial [Alloprevotella sp.]
MNHSTIKLRLTAMNFLEFAVWGAYLTSMGRYLSGVGMGGQIGWFYSVQGIVSIFMPGLTIIFFVLALQPEQSIIKGY